MILNKFIDKTLEAAKQSAQQIYGDDYAQLKSIIAGKEKEKKNKRRGATQNQQKQNSDSQQQNQSTTGNQKKGVVFERSTPAKNTRSQNSDERLNQKLKSIRKYAAQQTNDDIETVDRKNSTSETEPKSVEKQAPDKSSHSVNQLYSRKDIRKKNVVDKKDSASDNNQQQTLDEVKLNLTDPTADNEAAPLYDKFVKELPKGISGASEPSLKEPNEKHPDLLKRLDRLESLIHLALSAPENKFSAHPLFHKLLHKGVSQKLIMSWFDTITQQGIHPEQQPKIFQSKLLQRIDEQLLQSKADDPQKILLFTGRSGAGKTHLIMKLASLQEFMGDKNIAIASLSPAEENLKSRYSILKPFCEDHKIDSYLLTNIDQVTEHKKRWKQYDHILVDTPALEMGTGSLTKDIISLREELQLYAKTETHYLVNTAVNGIAFNDPLAKEISADHVALTHIDQSLKWGQTVQLLANTDYKLRYISSGPSIKGDLLPFITDKFARKLLCA